MLSPNVASGPATLDAHGFPLPKAPTHHITHRVVIDVLMAVEICSVFLAALLTHSAYITWFLKSQEIQKPYLIAGLVGGFVVHYVLRSWGLYSIASVYAWPAHLGRLVGALGLSFLTLVAIGFLLKVSPDYSRGWLLAWFGLLLLILPLGRLLSAHVMKGLESAGYMTRRIALIESRERPNELVDRLRRTPGIRLVGIFGDSPTTTQTGPRASISDLIEIGQHNQIDEVIVDLSNVSRPQLERLLDALGVLPVNVWLCASDIGRPVLTTAQLGSYNLLQIKPRPIGEWGALAKMAIDYSGSLIALILFAPLMMAIALAIKLDSRGPVFFRQRRHGYNHRVIDVIKFRTMHVTEDGNHIEQARKGDPRVTRVGRLLRHSSLDELPQLFNVLKGEMSLVGPRPHALAHNRFYGEKLERYANRHCVKPGITGWAQINGCRGQTEDLEQMRRRIELDLYYIEHWSLLLDLRILALTSFLGFVNRNAF